MRHQEYLQVFDTFLQYLRLKGTWVTFREYEEAAECTYQFQVIALKATGVVLVYLVPPYAAAFLFAARNHLAKPANLVVVDSLDKF